MPRAVQRLAVQDMVTNDDLAVPANVLETDGSSQVHITSGKTLVTRL